jgi:hypothetical protein
MKKFTVICLALAFGLTGAAFADRVYKVEEKEQIKKTLKFENPAKGREVEVDNIFGSIEVTGTDGEDVELIVDKIIRAKAQENVQKAKEEVTLDISQKEGGILFYVDGPFRGDERGERGHRSRYFGTRRSHWRDPGYVVEFDFKLRIPRKTAVFLSTVNSGRIRVENIEGGFEVRNVNGAIEMNRIEGSGEATTVNGGVKIQFTRNPENACSLKTINGRLEVFLPENIKADFRLKTFNGEGYSDFPVTYLPSEPAEQSRHDGKFIFRKGGFQGVQIGGKGGPEIRLETLNGDIYINKSKI